MTSPFALPQSEANIVLDISDLLALVARLDAERISALKTLVEMLEAASSNEGDIDFGGLLKAAQHLLGSDDTDMARTLGVSRPTIGRWIRNVSSPHSLTRSAICSTLVKKARGNMRLLQD